MPVEYTSDASGYRPAMAVGNQSAVELITSKSWHSDHKGARHILPHVYLLLGYCIDNVSFCNLRFIFKILFSMLYFTWNLTLCNCFWSKLK